MGLSEREKEFTAAEAAFSQAFCDAPPVQEFTHEKLIHTITYDNHMRNNSFTLFYITVEGRFYNIKV